MIAILIASALIVCIVWPGIPSVFALPVLIVAMLRIMVLIDDDDSWISRGIDRRLGNTSDRR